MTAYRRVDQKSGAALSAFSLFNTRRFPNTYVGHPLCFHAMVVFRPYHSFGGRGVFFRAVRG